jgi:hypothetical protein
MMFSLFLLLSPSIQSFFGQKYICVVAWFLLLHPPPLGIARGRSAWQFGLSHRVDEFVLCLMDNALTRVQFNGSPRMQFYPR